MTSTGDALDMLASVLASGGVHVQLRPERISSSVIHDATYHMALLSYTFVSYARQKNGRRSIVAAHLKLLQFVAARPELADDLDRWLQGQRKRQIRIEDWPRLPRGYLLDTTHDALLDYLEVLSCLRRIEDDVVDDLDPSLVDDLATMIQARDLFIAERKIIDRLAKHHVSKKSLGAG